VLTRGPSRTELLGQRLAKVGQRVLGGAVVDDRRIRQRRIDRADGHDRGGSPIKQVWQCGAATVNPARQGTKCAAWYRVAVASGSTVELRLRLRPAASGPEPAADLGAAFEQVAAARRVEADEFYA
jgi:hypothetical protein